MPGSTSAATSPTTRRRSPRTGACSSSGSAGRSSTWTSATAPESPSSTAVPDTAPRCDAVVTRSTEVALAVLVADCVPVLLSGTGGVVAAVHAGRPGLVAGVVPPRWPRCATSAPGRSTPSSARRCAGGATRCRPRCATPRPRCQPVSATVSWTGTPAIDVAAGVVAQLVAGGVTVRWVPGCSRESDHLYSYRRDGLTGRFAGVVAGPRRERTGHRRRRFRHPARRARGLARRRAGADRPGAGGCRARATRSRSSSSPSSSRPPTSTSWPRSGSPTSARTATRRRRPRWPSSPSGTGCGSTSSGSCRATRPASVARYADVVQSVDRAEARAGARPGGHGIRPRPRRHRPGRPRRRRGQGRGGPRRRAGPRRPRRRVGVAAAARRHGGGAARCRPRRRLRPAAGGGRRHTRRPPGRHWVSAGMSADLEAAVAEGATHLRVGSAILGSRQSHR